MTEQTALNKHSARHLSTKDTIINLIPLLIVLIAVVYFVHSCHDNQETAAIHNRFIRDYKASCCAFDESLEEFLRGNLPNEEFQSLIKDTYLPRMKALDVTCKALKPETVQSFPCMEEFKTLIILNAIRIKE